MVTKLKAVVGSVGTIYTSLIPVTHCVGEGGGFVFAGTAVEDYCTPLEGRPVRNGLVLTSGITVEATGGLALNNAIAMMKLDPKMRVFPVGCIGGTAPKKPDSDGRFILGRLRAHGLPTNGLSVVPGQETSFTDVSTVETERYFKHSFGACAFFGRKTFPFKKLKRRSVVMLGYLNLLPSPMANNGREAVALIKKLQKDGHYVVIDFTDRYKKGYRELFAASAGAANLIITNETSLGKGVGVNVYKGKKLDAKKLLLAAQRAIDRHPNLDAVVVHWPAGSMIYTRKHEVLTFPVHKLEKGDKVGATGAGDNWAVGFLYAMFMRMDLLTALLLATTAAEKSLGALSATDASGSLQQLRRFSRCRILLGVCRGLKKFCPDEVPFNWNFRRPRRRK